MGESVLLEGGLDLGERFGGDSGTDTIVRVDNDLLLLPSLGVDYLGLQKSRRIAAFQSATISLAQAPHPPN